MTAKDCNKSATPKKRLSLRSALALAARIGLLTSPVLAVPFTWEAATSLASTAIEFTSDFEDGNYNEWRAGEINTPWALQIVPGFGTNTTKVARFEYRNTDVNTHDTVKADLAGSHVPMGAKQFLRFDFNAKDFTAEPGKKQPLIFQYHAGKKAYPPPISLNVEEGDRLVQVINWYEGGKDSGNRYKIQTDLGKFDKEAWHTAIYEVYFSPNSDGYVKLTLDGKLIYTFNGIVGLEGSSAYPRVGIYQANDDKNTSFYPDKNVIYIDNFKMGPTLASVDSNSSPPPPDNKDIRVEAEQMFLAAYRIESKSAASNGQVVSLFNAIDTTDTASSTFSGDSGKYDVYVGYFDENDGVGNLQVSVGGVRLADWQLDQNLGSDSINAKTLVRKKVASGLSINTGAKIEIKGTANNQEWARVDYIDFVPVP